MKMKKGVVKKIPVDRIEEINRINFCILPANLNEW
jgi:hypothetical protein